MDYEKRIKDLLQAASTLLESNKDLGEKIELQIKRNQVLSDENAALTCNGRQIGGATGTAEARQVWAFQREESR